MTSLCANSNTTCCPPHPPPPATPPKIDYLIITGYYKSIRITSSKFEYYFFNVDLQKRCMYVHLINAVYPDLGVYIVLINAVLTQCYILKFHFSVLLTIKNSIKASQHNLNNEFHIRTKVLKIRFPVMNQIMKKRLKSLKSQMTLVQIKGF